MMKRKVVYLSILLLLTACNNPPMSFQWNDLEGYGTYYPKEMSDLEFAENGKGFSATDGVAELWVDTYLWMIPDDLSENNGEDFHDGDENELMGVSQYLQGQTGPVCVSDKTLENGDVRERRKTVACKDAFYTVSFSYPVNRSGHYQPYEAAIFDKFPVMNRRWFIIGK